MSKYSSVRPGWRLRRDLPVKIRRVLIALCVLALIYLSGFGHALAIFGGEVEAIQVDIGNLEVVVEAWEDSVARYEGVIEKCQQ